MHRVQRLYCYSHRSDCCISLCFQSGVLAFLQIFAYRSGSTRLRGNGGRTAQSDNFFSRIRYSGCCNCCAKFYATLTHGACSAAGTVELNVGDPVSSARRIAIFVYVKADSQRIDSLLVQKKKTQIQQKNKKQKGCSSRTDGCNASAGTK